MSTRWSYDKPERLKSKDVGFACTYPGGQITTPDNFTIAQNGNGHRTTGSAARARYHAIMGYMRFSPIKRQAMTIGLSDLVQELSTIEAATMGTLSLLSYAIHAAHGKGHNGYCWRQELHCPNPWSSFADLAGQDETRALLGLRLNVASNRRVNRIVICALYQANTLARPSTQ